MDMDTYMVTWKHGHVATRTRGIIGAVSDNVSMIYNGFIAAEQVGMMNYFDVHCVINTASSR